MLLKRFFGGFKKPKIGVNDNFEISNLRAIIKYFEDDIVSANQWIYNYENDKKKFKNNPKFQDKIQEMINIEIRGRGASEEALIYYRKELQEELDKQK